MKKKILVISLVLVLVATIAGGSLAWFIDDDEAVNVFTIGSVEIEQIEQQRDGNGGYEAFENDKMLIPVISNDTPDNDPNYQDKIVTVKNNGKNDAWVQTFIAVPKALDDAGVLHLDTNIGVWTNGVLAGTVFEGDITGDVDATEEYNIYKYVYSSVLSPDTTTSAVLSGVYIDQSADMNITYKEDGSIDTACFVMNGAEVTGFNAKDKLNVYVATQAIQAQGFDSADAGLANFDTHPWAD